MFKIVYEVEFVAGNLKGIRTFLDITYPLSSLRRVEEQMIADIGSRRVTSNYVCLNYRIVEK